MSNGWSRALGVGCNHCHNVNDWASEEKPDKELAREMAKMTGTINNDMLKKMEGVSKRANINCNTCHRGQKHPNPPPPQQQQGQTPPPPKKD
jgi:hypothetical protein